MIRNSLCLVIVTLLLPISVYANYEKAVSALKPEAYWRFEEKSAKSGAKDSSTISGTQTGKFQDMKKSSFGQSGPNSKSTIYGKALKGFSRSNKAIQFKGKDSGGDDVVLFADDDGSLNLSDNWAFTIALWVKGEAVQEDGAGLACKGEGGGGEQFCLDVYKEGYRFYVRNGENQATDAQSSIGPNGEWQHIVAVCDTSNSVMKIFVDGVEAISWSPPETLLDSLGFPLSIGSRQKGAGPFDNNFKGLIDEVAVWKRALSGKEIEELFLSAFDGDTPEITFGPTPPSAELLAKAEDKNGFNPLFNSELSDALTTNGWSWNKDGVLSHSQMHADLWTKKLYKDFILDLEFKCVWDTNSGVFIRGSNLNDWINTTIEAQILQQNGKVKKVEACGGIFDCLAPVEQFIKPVGEWNHYRVIANDNWIYCYVNGQLASSMDLNKWDTASKNPNGTTNKFKFAYKDLPRYGHLGLQDHGQKGYFRNAMVKELNAVTDAEAKALDTGVTTWLKKQARKMHDHKYGGVTKKINLGTKNSMNCVCYMQTAIWSPGDQKARLLVGSDDGIKIFLNGTVVHTANVMRSLKLDQDSVDVELVKGWNVLMLKVSNGGGGIEASARLVSQNQTKLKGIRLLKGGLRNKNMLEGKTPKKKDKNLADSDGYISEWVLSNPYRQKDKTVQEMLDWSFPPENKEDPKYRWRK